jgi:hypothetical protein
MAKTPRPPRSLVDALCPAVSNGVTRPCGVLRDNAAGLAVLAMLDRLERAQKSEPKRRGRR